MLDKLNSMKNILWTTALLLLLNICHNSVNKKVDTDKKITVNSPTKFYSKAVSDTLYIFVSLPADYDSKKNIKYPVIYLLDANLYFDIVAAMVKKYSEVDMLLPAILVGIGYKDFQTMDSLRSRDFTYPLAIPEYEMSVSGKADKFLSFINTELVPDIDIKYSTDKNNRVLVGHSLGGYFSVYALHQNLLNKNNVFSGYVAASPSTHYNHNYILNELEKLNMDNQSKIKSYITFGGLEDEEEEDSTMLKTDKVFLSLERSFKNKINYKGDTYSNLGHMDTPLPTFIKGLQWTLSKEQ
jgi:predicted alpha/beta superfamily hydrolase